MKVRPATLADTAELARGLKAVADEGIWLAAEPGSSLEELEKRVRRRFAEGGVRLALLDGEGAIVGSVTIRPTAFEGVWTLGMWILAEHRGQGGGRMLVEAAVEARPPEVHKITLETWPDNEPAIGLYEATGFEREGLLRDHYRRRDGSLRSSVVMARLFTDGR